MFRYPESRISSVSDQSDGPRLVSVSPGYPSIGHASIRIISFAAASTALVLLAGCGSSSPTTGGQAAASANRRADSHTRLRPLPRRAQLPWTQRAAMAEACRSRRAREPVGGASMTVNGVPASALAFQSAQKTCQKYLPRPGPVTAQQVANVRRHALAMAVGMRAHGVPNFPTTCPVGPERRDRDQRRSRLPSVDAGSPAFEAAQKDRSGLLLKQIHGPAWRGCR